MTTTDIGKLPAYAQFCLKVRGQVPAPLRTDETGPGTGKRGPKNFITWEAPSGHRTHLTKGVGQIKIDTTYRSQYVRPLPEGKRNGSVVGTVSPADFVNHLKAMMADATPRVFARAFGGQVAAPRVDVDSLFADIPADEDELAAE